MRKTLHSADYPRFLALLKAARKDAGIVQQELADRLGKPQSFVAKVEGGERRIDVIEFIAIAKAIGRSSQASETIFEAGATRQAGRPTQRLAQLINCPADPNRPQSRAINADLPALRV
jgi:transcriptional regulator with XRE-family HTH domain